MIKFWYGELKRKFRIWRAIHFHCDNGFHSFSLATAKYNKAKINYVWCYVCGEKRFFTEEDEAMYYWMREKEGVETTSRWER